MTFRPDALVAHLAHYGFEYKSIRVSDSSRASWPHVHDPHFVTKYEIEMLISETVIMGIMDAKMPVAPKNSIVWYLQSCILGITMSLPAPTMLDLDLEGTVVCPVDMRFSKNVTNPRFYDLQLTAQVIEPIVIPKEDLKVKAVFDTMAKPEESGIKIVKRSRIIRPKKWI